MKINRLTFVAFQLNGALGSGRFNDISIAEVKGHIREGSILEFLKNRLGHQLDLSLLEPLEKLNLVMEWADMASAVHNGILCVDKNGLCLLVGYLLEGIQRRASTLRKHAVANGFVEDVDGLDA